MAGSKKFFVYTTDLGDTFGILLDESNTEAVNGASGGDYTASSTERYTLPGNVSPRQLVYKSPDGKRTIKCVALTQANYNDALGTTPTIPDPITGSGILSLRQMIPETITLMPIPEDTGLDDGDAT